MNLRLGWDMRLQEHNRTRGFVPWLQTMLVLEVLVLLLEMKLTFSLQIQIATQIVLITPILTMHLIGLMDLMDSIVFPVQIMTG
jgi:hypothetical protein